MRSGGASGQGELLPRYFLIPPLGVGVKLAEKDDQVDAVCSSEGHILHLIRHPGGSKERGLGLDVANRRT